MFIMTLVTAISSSVEDMTVLLYESARTLVSQSFKRVKPDSYEKISLSKDKVKIQSDFKIIGNDMKKSIKKYSASKGSLKYE